jgi:protein-S-isoprenylcysteine O-methyltransferase Ste14
VFLIVAPGVVAGLVPWLLTSWSTRYLWLPVRLLGAVMIAAGLLVLLHAFAQFVVEGIGTPAPVAPTERLVVGGAYRYVRNPMYLAVVALIAGQALLLGQAALLLYAAAVGAVFTAFVRGYEEPTLAHRFGEQYQAYCDVVPRWRPRRRPWDPGLQLVKRSPREPCAPSANRSTGIVSLVAYTRSAMRAGIAVRVSSSGPRALGALPHPGSQRKPSPNRSRSPRTSLAGRSAT